MSDHRGKWNDENTTTVSVELDWSDLFPDHPPPKRWGEGFAAGSFVEFHTDEGTDKDPKP